MKTLSPFQFAAFGFLALLSGCAPIATSSGDMPADTFDQDRKAVLAMLGEYEVDFEFRETLVLQSGYEPQVSDSTGAHEVVILVEDSGSRISLQHLLVSGKNGHVTKHWRQDWEYQARMRFEFSEDQTWRLRTIPAALTQRAWTQCVFEVSDAPRYCGTGRWKHRNGAGNATSTWTSDVDWRPLPRREYTRRKDYNALQVVNRHTITPLGWGHEQDNTKAVRSGERVTAELVREFGFNDYRRSQGFDFKPAYDYWKASSGYWARVRAQWALRFVAGNGVVLKTSLDGMALIMPLFEQAEGVIAGDAVSDADIHAVFDRWVAAPLPQ